MPTFRFTHRDNETSMVFGAEKVQTWDSLKIGYTRNKTLRTLLRQFTSEFDFVKDVRKRIIKMFDKYGSEAMIYLKLEIGNENKDQSSFKQIGNGELKADMTSIEISELGAKLNYIDSSFEEVLMNRIDEEVEYNTHKSIDGATIPTFAHETFDIKLHDRVLEYLSTLDTTFTADPNLPYGGLAYSSFSGTVYYIMNVIPITSDSDIKTITGALGFIDDLQNLAENFVLLKASEAKTINWEININSVLKWNFKSDPYSLNYNGNIYFEIRHVNSDYEEKEVRTIKTIAYNWNDAQYQNTPMQTPIIINEIASFNLLEGDSLQMRLKLDNGLPNYSFGYPCYVYSIAGADNIISTNSKSYFQETTAKCIKPHELFSRYASIYTGEQIPFYSDLFGRTDLGYSVNGEWCDLVALNGLMIRQFPFEKCGFSTSLKDVFEAYCNVLNLGGTIEELTDGTKRFRVERYADFFDQSVVVKLGELTTGVTRTLNTENMFSELNIGYKDQEYEELNGLGTFNGAFNFLSNLKSVSNKMDTECKFRTDDYGIELARRKPYSSYPDEDTRFDDDIFLIDAIEVDGVLKARKTEGFAVVEGILNPSTAYNLMLSPGRNLRRWGNVIHSAMPYGGTLKFGSGAKNTALVTRLETETENLVEKADIDVTTLDEPLYLPEKISIGEAPLTVEQYNAIQSNSKGMFEITNKGVNLYGYVDEFEYNPSTKKISAELNRANR